MRKHFWMRHIDEEEDSNQHPQTGWVWGLVHVLGYHHHRWRFNIKKMIRTHKHGGHAQTETGYGERELLLGAKPSQATRRSIGSRIRRVFVQPRQRRSFRSIEDNFDGEKIQSEWKKQRPIIFVPPPPQDMNETSGFNEGLNILEIFKVDKDLLVKHLQHADQGIAKFSRSALRLNAKSPKQLSKSRSFPAVGGDRKIKPATLEDKQKDVWTVPREDRNVAASLMGLLPLRPSESFSDGRKRSHQRCSSLNDSMDKYTRLFDRMNSQKDVKLNSSRSFKLGSEQAQVELSFRRMQSLSKADSFRSILSFEIADEGVEPSQESLVMISRDSSNSAITLHIIEDQKEGLFMDDSVAAAAQQCEVVDVVDDDTILEHEFERDEGFVFSTNEIDIHLPPEDLESEAATTTNDGDMEFVMQILNHHLACFEQPPLSPKVLEESIRNHVDESYRHQLLFDLINEMLGDVYDASAAYYYPKPLSSSCHVRPFPVGEHAAKEVASRVESVVKLKPEEKQSIDDILWFDQTHDNRWMNLQGETECVALGIEDLIFRELAEEVFD